MWHVIDYRKTPVTFFIGYLGIVVLQLPNLGYLPTQTEAESTLDIPKPDTHS